MPEVRTSIMQDHNARELHRQVRSGSTAEQDVVINNDVYIDTYQKAVSTHTL
jgi:hypothetical protein